MNKILIYLIIISGVISHSASAQLTLTVTIGYPAPTYLSEWNSSRAGLATVIFNAADKQTTILLKFRTQLENSNGGVIAMSNNATARIFTIHSGANTFTLDNILQIDNLQFMDGVFANKIRTSGKLPSDNYQICVQLLSAVNDVDLTKAPVCRPFVQISYQLPYLLLPIDKTWLDANIAQSVITFRWSSLVPMSKEPVFYRLQVFEILDGQTSMQALRANQPILETDVRGTTQYFWRPQLNFKEMPGRIFIWTVQTLDAKGFPVTSVDENNQGRSDPRVFGVCDKLKHGTEDPGEDCMAGRKL